jgi:hypothetical protein
VPPGASFGRWPVAANPAIHISIGRISRPLRRGADSTGSQIRASLAALSGNQEYVDQGVAHPTVGRIYRMDRENTMVVRATPSERGSTLVSIA